MEMEAFTGKLHAYLRSVSTRIEELHTRVDKLDDRLTGDLKDQSGSFAAAVKGLDQRLSRGVQDNDARIREVSTLMTGVCGKLDQKFMEQIAEVDEKFTERVALHGARIVDLSGVVQHHHESFSEALGAVTQRFADKHAQQDALIHGHHEKFSTACARLEQSVSENTARLDDRCNEIGATLSARVDQLAASLREQQQHFVDISSKLDRKFTEKNDAQDQLFDDYRQDVASVCTKLDSKFSTDVMTLDARVQADHQHFTELFTQLDKQITEQLVAFDSKFSSLIASQQASFGQAQLEQDRRLDEEVKRSAERHDGLQSLCAQQAENLEERIAENCSGLDRKFTAENAEQHDRVEANHKYAVDVMTKLERRLLQDTRALDDKFTDACGKLEKWATSKVAEHAERIETEHTLFIQSVGSLGSKLSSGLADVRDQMGKDFSRLDSKINDAESRLHGRAEEHYSYFSGICAGLDKKLEELVGGVDQKTTVRLDGLDAAVRQVKSETNVRIDGENSHFSALCTQLDRNQKQGLTQLESRLSNTIGQVERACAQRNDELDERTENQFKQMGIVCETIETTAAKQISGITMAFDAKAAQQDEALRGLDTAFSKEVDQLRRVCDSMDERLTGDLSVYSQRHAEDMAECQKRTEALQQDLEAKTSFLEQKFSDKADAQDERVDEMSRTIHETKEQVTDTWFKLDSRFTQECGQLRQQVETDREHFAAAGRDLDAKVTETNALLSERVDREFEQFAQVCGKLDERLVCELGRAREQLMVEIDRANQKASEQHAGLLKRIDVEHETLFSVSEKLNTTIADNHSRLDTKLTEAYAALDKKYGEKIVQHEDRLGSEHRHFTDVCTRIEQTFNANLDELDAAFIEACNKLDAAGAENRTAIEQHHAHFTQCVDKLGQTMSAESAAAAKTVEKNRVQTLEALTKLEATLSQDIASLDSSMLEKSTQQDERVDELSAMLTQVETSVQDNLSAHKHESSIQLADAKSSLVADLRALEKKMDFEVRDQVSTLDASVVRRLTDLQNLVEDKVQQSIDTMSRSLEAMNTRVKKEMEPKLAETAMIAQSATAKLETLETRVMLEQDELKTGMTKSLEDMSNELEELGQKVDGMAPGLDINALLMGAASGSGS